MKKILFILLPLIILGGMYTKGVAQNVTAITQQLTQDKAAFNQEIQEAIVYLQEEASVASALRTPRKIQSVAFDGTQDINLPVFTTELDGLVPKRVGATTTQYLREDGTWVSPPDTTYPLLTEAIAEGGTATNANTISAKVLKDAIQFHAPTVTTITGNAGTATKLQTARTINGVSFNGSANITVSDTTAVKLTGNETIAGVKTFSSNIVGNITGSITGNAETATKLTTPRQINGVNFDGSANITVVDSTKLPLAGGTMTGAITAIRETKVAMAANNIDLATGNLFTKTISGATTLTISNALASGNVNSFVLELTNAGSATITWFSGVKWVGGTAPTLTTSGKDILGFYSHDGGTTWNVLGVNKDVK